MTDYELFNMALGAAFPGWKADVALKDGAVLFSIEGQQGTVLVAAFRDTKPDIAVAIDALTRKVIQSAAEAL